jgi:phospholipid/cholesterol/gamma-HCH transport system permease protein
MSDQPGGPSHSGMYRVVSRVGEAADLGLRAIGDRVRFVGGLVDLCSEACKWTCRSAIAAKGKLVGPSLYAQMVRVGVRAIPIVLLVQIFIGIILALQMAPTLKAYGQLQQVATVIGIAIVRELGPLITAIVLSGFAGASIAAEIGAMVEAEEVKALRAHALNPIQFLVVPRFLATMIMTVALVVLANVIGIFGGFLIGWLVLDIPPLVYLDITQGALKYTDYFTGLFKSGVFGMVIVAIACHEGLSVSGGAEGVGRATTGTVVKSIVALIGIDAVFTTVFYTLGW